MVSNVAGHIRSKIRSAHSYCASKERARGAENSSQDRHRWYSSAYFLYVDQTHAKGTVSDHDSPDDVVQEGEKKRYSSTLAFEHSQQCREIVRRRLCDAVDRR